MAHGYYDPFHPGLCFVERWHVIFLKVTFCLDVHLTSVFIPTLASPKEDLLVLTLNATDSSFTVLLGHRLKVALGLDFVLHSGQTFLLKELT